MNKLQGTGVAMITPFTQNGAVDTDALVELVEFNIKSGVDYIVVLGTTAENVTLTSAEKQLVIDTVKFAAKKRVPLVLGLGGNNTMALVESIEKADLSGFEAILSVSPYYNRPTQTGIIAHYKAVADASDVPVILYNVPSRTGSDLTVDTIVELANHPNIIGIKEACGDLKKIKKIIDECPEDFLVISGDDATALETVLLGGDGVISVLGQALPKEFSNLIRFGLEGNNQEAIELNNTLADLATLIFKEGNPTGVKVLTSLQGYGTSAVRLPLVKATQALENELTAAFERVSVSILK